MWRQLPNLTLLVTFLSFSEVLPASPSLYFTVGSLFSILFRPSPRISTGRGLKHSAKMSTRCFDPSFKTQNHTRGWKAGENDLRMIQQSLHHFNHYSVTLEQSCMLFRDFFIFIFFRGVLSRFLPQGRSRNWGSGGKGQSHLLNDSCLQLHYH